MPDLFDHILGFAIIALSWLIVEQSCLYCVQLLQLAGRQRAEDLVVWGTRSLLPLPMLTYLLWYLIQRHAPLPVKDEAFEEVPTFAALQSAEIQVSTADTAAIPSSDRGEKESSAADKPPERDERESSTAETAIIPPSDRGDNSSAADNPQERDEREYSTAETAIIPTPDRDGAIEPASRLAPPTSEAEDGNDTIEATSSSSPSLSSTAEPAAELETIETVPDDLPTILDCWLRCPSRIFPLLRLVDHKPPATLAVSGSLTLQGVLPHSISISKSGAPPKSYHFGRVFDNDQPDEIVDRRVGAFLEPLFERIGQRDHVCILTDGVSGSGKSWTMFTGTRTIADAAADALFAADTNVSVTFAAVQIIDNKATPFAYLKRDAGEDIHLATFPGKVFHYRINDCKYYKAKDAESLKKVIRLSSSKVEKESTLLNSASSRTFLVCHICLKFGDGGQGDLLLVDLAGAEPPAASQDADRTKRINSDRQALSRSLLDYSKGKEVLVKRNGKLVEMLGPYLQRPPPHGIPNIVYLLHINKAHGIGRSSNLLDDSQAFRRTSSRA